MNLSTRMLAVKNLVEPCNTACDVGCDHGYVSISLVKEGVAKKVIACDINEGPLKACRENVISQGLQDFIDTRLTDGLQKVDVLDGVDVIVIAGMGARVMCHILTEGIEVVKNASQLVLQPQSELFLVRKWIRENGFKIEKEEIVVDGGKYYFVMDVRPGKSEVSDPDTQHIYDCFSEYLIATKNPVLKEFLLRGLEKNNGYLEKISSDKRQPLLEENRLIMEALNKF